MDNDEDQYPDHGGPASRQLVGGYMVAREPDDRGGGWTVVRKSLEHKEVKLWALSFTEIKGGRGRSWAGVEEVRM